MWLLITPITVLTLSSTDLLSKILTTTISSLSTILLYMSDASDNTTIKNYYNELEELDIQLKLNLINNWIKKSELKKKETDLQIIYDAISNSCDQINRYIYEITKKIEYHYSKWFHSWRSINLDNEIKIIRKQTKILDNRINLINLI
jgi:hypothetical protein